MRRVVLATFVSIFAALVLSSCGPGQLVGPPSHMDAWLSYKYSQGCGPYPGTCKDPDGNPSITNTAETDRYYQAIGVEDSSGNKTNFETWLEGTGFSTTSAHAQTYYANKLDLQIGRNMHCWQSGQTVGCYVDNYGPQPVLGDGTPNPSWPNLSQAVDNLFNYTPPHFATVAMLYNPNGIGSNGDPVAFYVFDGSGNLANVATLDQEGPKTVPRMCMACHGGTYNTANHSVEAPAPNQLGASFLPFDVWSFYYSPTVPGVDRTSQQESFRQMNAMILATNPSPNIQALINGLYSNNVNVPNTTIPDNSYVPASWQTADGSGQKLYTGVFQQYCRMCHLAQDAPDFSSYTSFQNSAAAINGIVCNAGDMPHAEIPFGGANGPGFWWDLAALNDLNTVLQQKLGSGSGCPIKFK